jgi:hypothetical protein
VSQSRAPGIALDSPRFGCLRPSPTDRITTRQNDGRRHPGRSAERHVGQAREWQALSALEGIMQAGNRLSNCPRLGVSGWPSDPSSLGNEREAVEFLVVRQAASVLVENLDISREGDRNWLEEQHDPVLHRVVDGVAVCECQPNGVCML